MGLGYLYPVFSGPRTLPNRPSHNPGNGWTNPRKTDIKPLESAYRREGWARAVIGSAMASCIHWQSGHPP